MLPYLIAFCLGFLCCWVFSAFEDTDDHRVHTAYVDILATLEGYLRTKPLLNEAERSLLQKVSAIHDLD